MTKDPNPEKVAVLFRALKIVERLASKGPPVVLIPGRGWKCELCDNFLLEEPKGSYVRALGRHDINQVALVAPVLLQADHGGGGCPWTQARELEEVRRCEGHGDSSLSTFHDPGTCPDLKVPAEW